MIKKRTDKHINKSLSRLSLNELQKIVLCGLYFVEYISLLVYYQRDWKILPKRDGKNIDT